MGAEDDALGKGEITMSMRKMCVLTGLAIALLAAPGWADHHEPVAWWNFDDIDVERVEVEMVRGETFVPREILAHVTEGVSGAKTLLNAKYFEAVPGVAGGAVLLDGYTAYMEIGGGEEDDEE